MKQTNCFLDMLDKVQPQGVAYLVLNFANFSLTLLIKVLLIKEKRLLNGFYRLTIFTKTHHHR